MVEWHHRLNGHESEQTLGDGDGQRSLVCCGSWSCKESDTTEQPNNTKITGIRHCDRMRSLKGGA